MQVDDPAGDGDGVARVDADRLYFAAEGGGQVGSLLAEAQYKACAQAEGGDLTVASGERAGPTGPRSIVNVGEFEVGLNGPEGEAVVK